METAFRKDVQLVQQLHALGGEVDRGRCQFALESPTRADAAQADVELARLSDEEAKSACTDRGELRLFLQGWYQLRQEAPLVAKPARKWGTRFSQFSSHSPQQLTTVFRFLLTTPPDILPARPLACRS